MRHSTSPQTRALLCGAALAAFGAGAVAAAQDKDLIIGLTSDAVHLDPQAGEELSSNIMS